MEKIVILVVDDEAIIRMGIVACLEDAGYIVFEAADADAAVAILESRNDIRAVFTDIIMPGSLCGLRLAHTVRKKWPLIHLIVSSGLSAPTEKEFPRIGRFIPKPYGPRQVVAALQELFAPAPAPYRYSPNVIQNYGRISY
jgi:two-component system, response regulator PdtaR